jgi:AcrR family transcriptional regulator
MIAEQAGVSETHLFRHFGTKANLFEVAIFQPLADLFGDFVSTWDRRMQQSSLEELGEEYIRGLFQLLREHRELVLALLTTQVYEIDVAPGTAGSPLSGILDQATAIISDLRERGLLSDWDPVTAPRILFGMVFGMAVLDEWLFPISKRPSQARLVRQLDSMMFRGLTGGASQGQLTADTKEPQQR